MREAAVKAKQRRTSNEYELPVLAVTIESSLLSQFLTFFGGIELMGVVILYDASLGFHP